MRHPNRLSHAFTRSSLLLPPAYPPLPYAYACDSTSLLYAWLWTVGSEVDPPAWYEE